MRKWMRFAVCSMTVAAGCATDDSTTGTGTGTGAVVVTDTIGDTIVVRTVSGSAWGAARLVPDLSIGELDGEAPYLFGRVRSLAVDDDRNLYVLDQQVPEVRKYNPDGTYVRSFGRAGQGPGELASPMGIAVLSDGRVVARDSRNRRVQVWDPEGTGTQEWPYESGGSATTRPLWVDASDRTWLIARDPTQEVGSFATILIRLRSDGSTIDTLSTPSISASLALVEVRSVTPQGASRSRNLVPFTATTRWAVHASGNFIVGSAEAYRIDLDRPDGTVLRIERIFDAVRVQPAERDYFEDIVTRGMRSVQADWDWNGPPIPDVKPAFRALYAARDGRIWVQTSTAGFERDNPDHDATDPESFPVFWTESVAFDVFEPDGSYLGAVTVPDDFSVVPEPVFDGDFVWSATRDAMGVERVVRYRIER